MTTPLRTVTDPRHESGPTLTALPRPHDAEPLSAVLSALGTTASERATGTSVGLGELELEVLIDLTDLEAPFGGSDATNEDLDEDEDDDEDRDTVGAAPAVPVLTVVRDLETSVDLLDDVVHEANDALERETPDADEPAEPAEFAAAAEPSLDELIAPLLQDEEPVAVADGVDPDTLWLMRAGDDGAFDPVEAVVAAFESEVEAEERAAGRSNARTAERLAGEPEVVTFDVTPVQITPVEGTTDAAGATGAPRQARHTPFAPVPDGATVIPAPPAAAVVTPVAPWSASRPDQVTDDVRALHRRSGFVSLLDKLFPGR